MNSPTRSISENELLENLGWIQVLARSLVRDGSTADDVVQDTWLRALERPPRAREGAGLKAWLAKVTRSRARTDARSARRRARHEAAGAPSGEAQPSTLEVVERAATQKAVVEELMRLEEPDRSTVLQRYLDGLSASDIARARGESPAAVRKRLSRATEKLRARLEPRFGGREALFSSLVACARPAAPSGPGLSQALVAAGVVVAASTGAWFLLHTPEPQPERELVAALAPAVVQDTPPAQDAPPVAERTPVAATVADGVLRFAGLVLDLPHPDLDASVVSAVPARGVSVALTIGDPGPGDKLKRHTTTDADGRFLFEVTEEVERTPDKPARVQLWIDDDDERRFARRILELAAEEEPPAEIRLERAAHGALRGRVVDPAGEPIEGALITTRATWGLGGGTPEPEPTETDADGRFDLGLARESYELQAAASGWRQLQDVSAVREKNGGWQAARIVMAPAGAVVLDVRDESAEPVPGVTILAGVSRDEPQARGESSITVSAVTDQDGRAVLEDVWTDVKLRLQVQTAGGAWEAERSREGLLVRPDEPGDAPLVVPGGGVLELGVRLPGLEHLHGRVVDEEGQPVPNAAVFLLLPDQLTFHAPRELSGTPDGFGCRRTLTADGEGRFEATLLLREELETLRVIATNGRADLPVYTYAGQADYTAATSVTLALAELVDEVVLELEPTHSITGFVLDHEGRPVAGEVGFQRADELPRTRLDRAETRIEEDGGFTITGLLPGTVDLEVSVSGDYFFTWCRLPRRFPGIEVGTQGLELVIEEPELVRVTISATHAGEPVEFAGLMGLHTPFRPRPTEAATPASEASFARGDGWPASATLALGYGQAGGRSELGSERYMYLGRSAQPYTFEPVTPGWYRIGIRGWTEDGEALHPSGTGLVYLAAGDYRFDFELSRAGELKGQILGDLDPDLCVGLRDGAGALVHTLTRKSFLGPTSPIGADGGFWLQTAPAGEYTLVVGLETELRAGSARYSETVEIPPGTPNPRGELRIDLR